MLYDGDGVAEVCTACGVVVESCTLQSASNKEGLSYLPSSETAGLTLARGSGAQRGTLRCVRGGTSRGNKLQCEKWLRQATVRFGMDSASTERVRALYQGLASRGGLEDHIAKAAACCYMVLKEEGRPITLTDLASIAQCSGRQLRAAMRLLAESDGKGGPCQPLLEDLVAGAARGLQQKDRDQVVSQARALLCPLRRCWFLEGRAPRCLLPALLYMSWKSLDPARGKVPLEAFCKQHSMSSPTSAVRRTVTDLKRVLVHLAEQIPWVQSKHPKQTSAHTYIAEDRKSVV